MRKRKPTTARRKKANPQHPKTRRVSIKVNPKKRRRNPSVHSGTGLVKDALIAAAGGLSTSFVRSMVPVSIGGNIGNAAITAAVAYGLGEVAGRFISPAVGRLVAIGGASVAAAELLTSYNLTPQALFAPKPQPQPVAAKAGVGDIVALPRGPSDSYYGSSVVLPRRGMNDIVAVRRSRQ